LLSRLGEVVSIRTVQMFFKCLTNLFPLWSVLVVVIALIWPSAFEWFSTTMIRVGLGIIMLGMGLTLTVKDFKRVFYVPLLLLGGVSLQFVVMPFLGWGIGNWMDLPRDMAVGLVLVSCCPGGTASNVIAFLARANVALSVSMTAISTTLAVVLTPFLTKFYVGERVPVDTWGLLQSILIIVILPVTGGIVMNHFFGNLSKRLSAVSPFVSVVFIILIVGYILTQNRESVMENWRMLVAAVLMLHVGGFALGYCLARLFRFDEQSSRTVSIEVGMQNSGLGAALATKHFEALPLAPVPCAVSAVTHCILGSLAAGFWRIKSIANSKAMIAKSASPVFIWGFSWLTQRTFSTCIFWMPERDLSTLRHSWIVSTGLRAKRIFATTSFKRPSRHSIAINRIVRKTSFWRSATRQMSRFRSRPPRQPAGPGRVC